MVRDFCRCNFDVQKHFHLLSVHTAVDDRSNRTFDELGGVVVMGNGWIAIEDRAVMWIGNVWFYR